MKECAFCPATANLTAEHIISEWIEDLFPGKSTVKYKDGRGRIAEWDTEKIDWKARVVCASCNNGWMSDIEAQRAKPVLTPLITGEQIWIPITQETARSIAIFAFKTAVVMDHAYRRNEEPWFPSRLRYGFRENQSIPSGLEMWMCAASGLRKLIYLESGYYAGNLTPTYPVYSYVCTVAIGHFVFQLHSGKHFGYTKLYPLPDFDAIAVQFWPHLRSGMVWPFAAHLRGNDDFRRFCMRWREFGPNLPG